MWQKGRQKLYFRVYRTFLSKLVDSGILTLHELGLVTSLMRFLDWESNYLVNPKTKAHMSASELAEWLNTDRANFSRKMSRLVAKGILLVDKNEKKSKNHYLLNPDFAVMGHEVGEEEKNAFEFIQISATEPTRMQEVNKKRTLPPALRFSVLYRDDFKCKYCGKSSADGAVLHVDHVHPESSGGDDSPDNLVTSCKECNVGKGSKVFELNPL